MMEFKFKFLKFYSSFLTFFSHEMRKRFIAYSKKDGYN